MSTPIFYDHRMSVDLSSYSQSSSKPRRFIELMQHYKFHAYNPSCLGSVTPIKRENLYRVHKKEFVDGVFNLTEPNGFGDCNPSLPESTLWTIGSLLSAARHAIKYPALPTCSPTSGYHHSCYDYASGFCTFNGLMVVAAILQDENPNFKCAVLDCDAHFSDGTVDVLKHHKNLNVLNFTSGQHFYGDRQTEDALDFQVWLHSAIEEINAYEPDLVIYQAGADQHKDDALRSGFLTTDEMRNRDRAVFRNIRAPLVWNLAGGYSDKSGGSIFQDPVLQIHRNTLLESDASVTHREAFFGVTP